MLYRKKNFVFFLYNTACNEPRNADGTARGLAVVFGGNDHERTTATLYLRPTDYARTDPTRYTMAAHTKRTG
jgi:hypothetical protein